jgi:hypothetical protein
MTGNGPRISLSPCHRAIHLLGRSSYPLVDAPGSTLSHRISGRVPRIQLQRVRETALLSKQEYLSLMVRTPLFASGSKMNLTAVI